ncbi:unnamed protein product [Hyaloperonospora brassicae]|uniref:Agenet domain-containing protein n=1 Tax=Hyaloperonospora brassicae TaxID=162125 RepID=A0AAV0UHA4_HYABA|nr:unnamed protein product [Hyaloperonospora brassicae]
MADLSFLARFVLTLLVSALSLYIYKRLQLSSPSSPSSSPPTSRSTSTKRSKKRSKKPKKATPTAAASDASSSSSSLPSDTRAAQPDARDSTAAAAPTSLSAERSEESDSDSDEGLSAAQVLATRKFQPKRLGSSSRASASLPAEPAGFTVDQEVLARFRGGDRWFPARVLERRKGNEYHLKYDDGEVEYRVSAACIKPRTSDADTGKREERDAAEDSGKSEERDGAQALVSDTVAREASVQQKEETGSDSGSSSSDDDGWQVVGTSKTVKQRHVRRAQGDALAEPLVDGLTKRQRENRRKKERQREKKELLRQHAQKDDLDARARWRYVPS